MLSWFPLACFWKAGDLDMSTHPDKLCRYLKSVDNRGWGQRIEVEISRLEEMGIECGLLG